jgi:uncharacterized membrane protein YebE (DUF533 family)
VPRGTGPDDLEQQARELEDMLNVASDRNSRRTEAPLAQTPPMRHQPSPAPTSRNIEVDQSGPNFQRQLPQANDLQKQNAQALILVQAMVNAAKSDGQITQAEQQAILGRLNNPSPETIQFLREEFSKPLNAREFAWSVPLGMEQQVYSMSLLAIDLGEFAWSVPLGMEQQVYSMSLLAIDLDSQREDDYLRDLAHGLRLPEEQCEQIKERMGVAGTARFGGGR